MLLAFSELKCLRLYNNRVSRLTSKFPPIPDIQRLNPKTVQLWQVLCFAGWGFWGRGELSWRETVLGTEGPQGKAGTALSAPCPHIPSLTWLLCLSSEYSYQYSSLGCPKRCVEYVRITGQEKNVFLCCNETYCNSVNVKDVVPFNPAPEPDLFT